MHLLAAQWMDLWLSSGYATFSSMVSESNSALSWNSMPIWLRISNSSARACVVRSCPNSEHVPGVGLHQAEGGLQQHRLAAAGRAQDHARFALRRPRRRHRAAPRVVVEGDADVFEAQDGWRLSVGHQRTPPG